uniref:Uncharacterized protein n=1 Tax=Maylandia zebra TaxID=106582 RepID=A0A3P9CZK1_9CICH
SFGSGLLLGARSEELGRSASGSAFAPYSGPATSPGFGPQLPYGGEPRAAAALSSYVVSARGDGQGSGPGLVPVRTMKISPHEHRRLNLRQFFYVDQMFVTSRIIKPSLLTRLLSSTQITSC